MTDIVERLRRDGSKLAADAIAEIERLRFTCDEQNQMIYMRDKQSAELLAALEEIAKNGWAVEAKIARAAIEKAKT